MAKDRSAGRRRRSAVIYTPIAVLLIAMIAIFGISVFFRVTVVEVTGAQTYTVEQIQAASGIRQGGNLLFVDTDAVEGTIKLNLPYLSEVVVERIIPNTITIKVAESRPLAVINTGGSWWIMDQKARVLEKTNSSGLSGKIVVTGLEPVTAGEGLVLNVEESDKTKLSYLTNVLTALEAAGLAGEVTRLDVSNIAYITLNYGGRFTVLLGSGENTAYRLGRVEKIIAKLDEDDRGKIDVSDDESPARFVPE